LSENWQIIASAPFAFISFAIIIICLVYLFMRILYKERIENLKEKITIKGDLINEYRQRLHIVNINITSYSKLSNKELKAKASYLFYQMREYYSKKSLEEIDYNSIVGQRYWQAKSNE
jgi:hypothetical protein